MAGLLTRWRQFGIRYFWPHLLFGMVAASVGLPVLPHGAQPAAHKPDIRHPAQTTQQILLQANWHAQSFRIDRWRQQAISSAVIHNLSFSLAPQILSLARVNQTLDFSHRVLSDGIHSLLAASPVNTAGYYAVEHTHRSIVTFRISNWLSQVCGIRAGPQYPSALFLVA